MKQEKKRPLPKALLDKSFLAMKDDESAKKQMPYCFFSLDMPPNRYLNDIDDKKSLYRIVKIKK